MSEAKRFAYLKEVLIGGGSGLVVLALLLLGLSISGPNPTSNNNGNGNGSQASSSASPSASVKQCLVNQQINDPLLGDVQAIVVNAADDQVLFDVKGEQPSATASTMKLLTSAAALQSLGPNYRVQTRVYRDPVDQGIIYFVGGGDVTLSRTQPGKQSVYQGAPKLNDLAVQINRAVGTTPITKIVVDGSMFAGPQWLPGVDPTERTQGYLSLTSALQVDGDRNDPTRETSPRSTTPEIRAGKWLQAAIGANATDATVEQGSLNTSSMQIAMVQSQPISSWINHMMAVSDNTQAEALARLVSLDEGYDGSFSSLDAAIKKALSNANVTFTGAKIYDGSGESTANAISPADMAKLVKQIYLGSGDFSVIRQSLPVSGESGSLSSRFKGANVDAAGKVFAKTGWIKHGYTLAGYITAKDNSVLLFAVYALGPKVEDPAKGAIDNLVTGFYRCGAALGPATIGAATPKN
jgi:D-alanyl-D-alanine carboxypeptidase/D-alanyl-D-alanine-endopeptidase (penicillin-binding protein 4)